MLRSLKTRLLVQWSLSLIASIAVSAMLIQLYRQSTDAQIGRAEAVITRACDLIGDQYRFYTAGWSAMASRQPDNFRPGLNTVVTFALAHEDGVEGGLWRAGTGSLAYAFPTYQGTGPKTDLPEAERDEIKAVNQRAAEQDQPVERRVASRTQTLLLHACPLSSSIGGLTAWTMTRVQSAAGLRPLQYGFGILLGLVVVMSIWLGRTLVIWGRHVRGIEAALAQVGHDGMPAVPRTGERELDRIIDALNEAGRRLATARRDADQLTARVARAERLAGLGRVAAGVAHEIRNPIAAARLQGENALAGDDRRRRHAITDMLGQIDRLDAHVAELLAMTQRVDPRPILVDLPRFLAELAARHQEIAAAAQVSVRVQPAQDLACFDPAVVGRVLDNLMTNAIRHTPPGGTVTLAMERDLGSLTLTVADTGPGIPPEMTDHLFEPFMTSRPDGTGLGLAIARELTDAHGGCLVLRQATGGAGAMFALTLPQEDAWPQS